MVCNFTSRNIAIVTGSTVINDTAMIKSRTCKTVKVVDIVTHGTVFSCRYVVTRHADTDFIVMTRSTVISNTGMIIESTAEGAGHVTYAAVLTGWHVVNRHANRRIAVVTFGTQAAGDISRSMIDIRRRKAIYVMTVAAIGIGNNVVQNFPRGVITIVTGLTRL